MMLTTHKFCTMHNFALWYIGTKTLNKPRINYMFSYCTVYDKKNHLCIVYFSSYEIWPFEFKIDKDFQMGWGMWISNKVSQLHNFVAFINKWRKQLNGGRFILIQCQMFWYLTAWSLSLGQWWKRAYLFMTVGRRTELRGSSSFCFGSSEPKLLSTSDYIQSTTESTIDGKPYRNT